jgi:hypothetical protein
LRNKEARVFPVAIAVLGEALAPSAPMRRTPHVRRDASMLLNDIAQGQARCVGFAVQGTGEDLPTLIVNRRYRGRDECGPL